MEQRTMSDLITEAVEGWKTANTENKRLGASHSLMNDTDFYANISRIANETRVLEATMDKWRKRHAVLKKVVDDGWRLKHTDNFLKSETAEYPSS